MSEPLVLPRNCANCAHFDGEHWCTLAEKCADFVAKAAAESRTGCTVVMLLPARTDTRYFHDYIWDAERHQPKPNIQVRFIKGRLKFGDAANSAPFPSMVVVFRP